MSKTNKKLNILHLMSSFPVGGMQQVLANTAKTLAEKEDINNSVVILSGIYDENYINQLKSINNIDLNLFTQNNFKNPLIVLFKLIKIVLKNKIQLIHTHDVDSKKFAILLKILFPKMKLVHTVHDTNLLNLFSNKHLLISRIFYDKHIAISNAVKDDCKNFAIDKTEIIYNGIDFEKFYSKKPSTNNNESFNIINVARIQLPKKGQDILIKALNECKKRNINFKCTFVGGYAEEDIKDYEYLQNLVSKYSLKENINFLGNRFDVPELLFKSDLFILPSRFEGFGLVVLEAMAAGLPVIVSNIDGPKEYIKHEINGLFFENENEIDLADKIQYLYENKQKMFELALAGQEDAKQFDNNVACEKYLELYKTLIQKD